MPRSQLFFAAPVVFIRHIAKIARVTAHCLNQVKTNIMVSDSQEKPPESLTDECIIQHLRRQGDCTISELTKLTGVTHTAIRLRLNRLMEQGLVLRQAEERTGRGRPTHRYSLTRAGQRSGGSNCEDLAGVLWSELRSIKDVDVRQGLLRRIAGRLTETYQGQIEGAELQGRMESLVSLMAERDVPFEVNENEQGLPVLTALSCPYPDLAEQDRSICAMEKMLFSEILDEGLRLSECRLDGAQCCTFEPGAAATSHI